MSSFCYGCLWVFFNVIGRLFFRYRTVGQEHIPRKGGVLVAANHASYLDIPFLGCGMPRRAWYLGRQDLFPFPGLKPLFQWLGWIPIKVHRLDRAGFGRAIKLIQAGRVVVIFPEGGRTPDGRLRLGKPGLGVIVAETGCPVVPAYIGGTREALPMGTSRIRFRPIWIAFGEPISFAGAVERSKGKELYQHISRTVMDKIAELGRVAPPSESLSRQAANDAAQR